MRYITIHIANTPVRNVAAANFTTVSNGGQQHNLPCDSLPSSQLVLLTPPSTHITSVKDVLLNKIRASISTQYNPNDNNSLTLSVTRAKAFSPNDRSNIVFTRNHLRLLLSSHPALYLRSSYKFASVNAVANYLIKRVDTITDWTSTSPTLSLIFDRKIALPPPWGDEIEARQEEDALVFSTLKKEGEEESEAETRLGLDEIVSISSSSPSVEGPLPDVLKKLRLPSENGGDFGLDRTIYSSTATISGTLQNVSVRVLPNQEFLVTTSALSVGSASVTKDSQESSTPLILKVEDCKKLVEAAGPMYKPRNWHR